MRTLMGLGRFSKHRRRFLLKRFAHEVNAFCRDFANPLDQNPFGATSIETTSVTRCPRSLDAMANESIPVEISKLSYATNLAAVSSFCAAPLPDVTV
jgi:hypothetical protein